jgi:hypothetical protein
MSVCDGRVCVPWYVLWTYKNIDHQLKSSDYSVNVRHAQPPLGTTHMHVHIYNYFSFQYTLSHHPRF